MPCKIYQVGLTDFMNSKVSTDPVVLDNYVQPKLTEGQTKTQNGKKKIA